MKKQKRIFTIFILSIFLLATLANFEVFASNSSNSRAEVEYSEEYKKWLELSDEEKQKVIKPRMYDVTYTRVIPKNPLLRANMLRTTSTGRYTLQDFISNNLIIKNQQQTDSCWAFAALSSLETNLALANKNNGGDTSKVYDFSERHMEYATSRVFEGGEINELGYNRTVGGGSWEFASSYLTNGQGAINESDMPFENNEDVINIDAIQGKTVRTQVYDTVEFPDYNDSVGILLTEEESNEIKNQIKQHIQNYGSVFATVKAGSFGGLYPTVSDETGALAFVGGMADHAVSIVGWDDNYAVSNWDVFEVYTDKPEKPGAWIARNSWGTESGEEGYIYISYEDTKVSRNLSGIIKATDSVEYDNLYQYDYYSPNYPVSCRNRAIFCNIFDRNTTSSEYLTQVSLYVSNACVCKVYVNPNGTEKTEEALQPVLLETGDSETFNTAGYHTLEFLKPVEITSNKFAVAIEIIEIDDKSVAIGCLTNSTNEASEYYSVVDIQKERCFMLDTYKYQYYDEAIGSVYDYDWSGWEDLSECLRAPVVSTIKAFTTNELIDESLKNIVITNPPTKTKYWAGENFDKTGMVVTANYNSRKNPSAVLDSSSYSISNGTKLRAGQTSVTITYEDKTIEQPITVIENKVESIAITNPPTNLEYWAGDDFNNAGMVVMATYTDGTTVEITDYRITNGTNLRNGQSSIIVSYGDKTAEQEITVKANPVVKIEITKAADKLDYVVGQNFNKAGMIVKATYTNGKIREIADYEIKDGNNLTERQETVTISYEGQEVTQDITVVAKAITEINVKTMPTKTKYIQNKEELNLTGGVIEVKYNDDTTETVEMTSNEVSVAGFDNSNLGKITITLTYLLKTTQYEVEIIEEEKAENSKMDKIATTVEKVKAYYFTDDAKQDYMLIDVNINGIEKNTNNDKIEYYYYMSPNKNESNITEWVKIEENQGEGNIIKFTIDTTKIENYNEISNSEVVYLYLREVAIKGGNQSVATSQAMIVETNKNIEIYIDNVKKDDLKQDTSTEEQPKDDTVTQEKIPDAGVKMIVVISIIVISFMGCVIFIKYKKISKYVK